MFAVRDPPVADRENRLPGLTPRCLAEWVLEKGGSKHLIDALNAAVINDN